MEQRKEAGHVASDDWGLRPKAMVGCAAVEDLHGATMARIEAGGFEEQIAGDLCPIKARLGFYCCPHGKILHG